MHVSLPPSARLAFVLLAVTSCRKIPPTEEPPEAPVLCQPLEESVYTPNTATTGRLGYSTAVMPTGVSTNQNLNRLLIAGAPGSFTSTASGKVHVSALDLTNGHVNGTSPLNQLINAPPGQRHFGTAVLGMDARVCRPSGVWELGCGQELLVSAPDMYADPINKGTVYWYEPTNNGNAALQPAGAITAPAGYAVGAQFGASLATDARATLSGATPWAITPYDSQLLAVGAPGDERVATYTVTESLGSPFGFLADLPSPLSWDKGYGSAVAVGDFDGDSDMDVAVGAPRPNGTDVRGRVYVWANTGGGFASTPLLLDGGAVTAGEDLFGASLAAGRIFDNWGRDALVVGAPGHLETYSFTGAICAFALSADPTAPSKLKLEDGDCNVNPHYPTSTDHELFGTAVSIGNFQASDFEGRIDTTQARLGEIAVSRPGADNGLGAVDIYFHGTCTLSSTGGPPKCELDISDTSPMVSEILELPSTAITDGFGTALATGYTQNSMWADLAIGNPYRETTGNVHGATTLTVSTDVGDCADLNGTWEATSPQWATADTDGDGIDDAEAAQAVAWSEGGLVNVMLIKPLRVQIRDDEGAGELCSADFMHDGKEIDQDFQFELAAGTVVSFEDPWTCGDGGAISDVAVDMSDFLLEVAGGAGLDTDDPAVVALFDLAAGLGALNGTRTFDFNPGSPDTFQISFSDVGDPVIFWAALDGVLGAKGDLEFTADCRVQVEPVTFQMIGGSICDP